MSDKQAHVLPPESTVEDVTQRIPLHAEELTIARRTVDTATVQVRTVTRTRELKVDEPLTHQRVNVERVAVGRFVEAVPPVREEGDVTVIPVVEEVVVVERRLLLKEEVRIRRVKIEDRHVETVQVREQEAVITRTPAKEKILPNAEN